MMEMKVLVIGWEFPPNLVGGLGTHLHELLKELRKSVDVTLFLPFKASMPGIKIVHVPARWLNAYKSTNGLVDSVLAYNKNIVEYVKTKKLEFDLIHVHDWLGIPAGIGIKKITGKPLVITFHSTEFDRTAGHPWERIAEIEREGLKKADLIIAVSEFMKRQLIEKYSADPSKIKVIYNGINPEEIDANAEKGLFKKKVVLYLGRLEIQKNPETFIRAIPLVLSKRKDVLFVVAGTGGMLPRLADLSVELGVKDHVIFTGRVTEEEKKFLYKIADVFVLPSYSEPFGITVLEATAKGAVPIISKTVGAGERIEALKMDFWDINKLAEYILAILDHPVLGDHIRKENLERLEDLSWSRVARQVLKAYRSVVRWTL